DVISPEALPPLELESAPADVGELITDQLSHLWFTSLLRNLADRFVPERLPKLELASKPMADIIPKTWIMLPAWSEVISTPKVFYPDKTSVATPSVAIPRPAPVAAAALPAGLPKDIAEVLLLRDIRRSRIRSYVWISMAAVQALYLIGMAVWPHLH